MRLYQEALSCAQEVQLQLFSGWKMRSAQSWQAQTIFQELGDQSGKMPSNATTLLAETQFILCYLYIFAIFDWMIMEMIVLVVVQLNSSN